MLSNEKYINQNINQNICEKCNKYNKEKGFDICKSCINEILDKEYLEKYLLSIEQKKVFQIENMQFENYDFSFDELFKFSLYYPNINKYIDYIKSKICVKCLKPIEERYQKLPCGCYICKKCFDLIEMINPNICPICPLKTYIQPNTCLII